jgi:hypothetical protein
LPKKKEDVRVLTALDYVREALAQARFAYEFVPSSYTHGVVIALIQAERVLRYEMGG